MGWSFYCNPAMNRAYVVNEMKDGRDLGKNYRVLACSAVGGKVFRVIEAVEGIGELKAGDRRFIVDLIKGGGRGEGWGNKDVPSYEHVDFPLYMLELIPNEYGKHDELWRAQVREYHHGEAVRAKFLKGLVPGMVVSVYGKNYRLLQRRPGKVGWLAVRAEGIGPTYRLTKNIKPAVAA